MDRVIAANSVAFANRDVAPGSGTPQYFTNGVPGTVPATVLPGYFLNMLMDEMRGVIVAAGIVPSSSDWTQLLQAIKALARIKLSGNVTLYVNSGTGNDGNTGLSSGAAFATLQHAWNVIISTYDLAGFVLTISVANGTYAPFVASGVVPGATSGSGSIVFTGNTSTPDNCIVSATNGSAVAANGGAQFTIQGFKLSATGTGAGQGFGLFAESSGCQIAMQLCDTGSCDVADVCAAGSCSVAITGNYTISGTSGAAWIVNTGGVIIAENRTITLSGTPSFTTAFASASGCGVIECDGNTFSGGATGVRYLASLNGVIGTNGGGANYLPGNSAGSTQTGGQYA